MPELRIWFFACVAACSSKDAPAPAPAPAPPKDAGASNVTLLMATPTQVDGGWVIDAVWQPPAETKNHFMLHNEARCVIGDRLYRSARAMWYATKHRVFDEPLPKRPERCELTAYLQPFAKVPDGIACWSDAALMPGPCASMPKPAKATDPIAIEDFTIEASQPEIAMAWTIVEGSAKTGNLVRPEIACAIGNTVYADRPRSVAFIANRDFAPGERWRVRRAAFDEVPLPGAPSACEIALQFEQHEFEHEPKLMMRACWTPAGVTPDACTTMPKLAPPKPPVAIGKLAIGKGTDHSLSARYHQETYRVTAELTLGVAADGIDDGPSAEVHYKDGTSWRTVDGRMFRFFGDVTPGQTRLMAIELPPQVTAVPHLLELAFDWTDKGAKRELATYCFTDGKPRTGRCPR